VADHFFTASTLRLRDDPRGWKEVAGMAGVAPERLQLLQQVHGSRVVAAPGETTDVARPEADGIVSDDPSLALVVRVADCAPILIADRARGAVAAVHAGWRSTMASIAVHAVARLRERYGSRPDDLVVAIGPCLGVCCGEMGQEVMEAFRTAGHDDRTISRWFTRRSGQRPHFDLWRANQDQLEASGVRAASIHVSGLCTRTHAGTFHSYRAQGADAGRMAAVIRARAARV
jgi:YfiH family protein